MTPSLLPILLESAMRGLIAAVAVWVGLRVFRVKNVPAQKAAWGLMLLAALAMPVVMRSSWLPAWTTIKLPSALLSAKTVHSAAAAVPVPMTSQPRPSENMAPEPDSNEANGLQFATDPIARPEAMPSTETERPPISTPATPQPRSHPFPIISPARLLFAGWTLYLAVCALLLVRLLGGLAMSLWLWKRANLVDTSGDPEFPALIRVRWSSRIGSPVNIGSGILLPADYAEWSKEKLRVVLAHEHSHIRQRDFYLQFVAGLYAAFTWFSPLGWWLKRKLSDLAEAISDHAGLAVAASPSAYAGLLLEFAALPRPALNGVAMASSRNLSHRIERLLNQATFQRAFAGGRRALLAVLITLVLIAAPAMVRVRTCSASQQASAVQPAPAPAQTQAPAPAALTGQSNPAPAQIADAAAVQAPAAQTNPEPPPPALPPAEQHPAPAAAPVPAPPAPPEAGAGLFPVMPPMPRVHVDVVVPKMPEIFAYVNPGPCLGSDDNGYAIVGDPGSKTRFCGDWDDEGHSDIEKARSQAHGHFLLFRHEGKLYILDDPETMRQIDAMGAAADSIRDQMREMGKQMRDESQQAREAARKARETAQNIPAPDLSKEVAELDATAANLKQAQGGTVSREQLQVLQREISELQRRVIEAEIKVNVNAYNGDFMAEFGKEQGKYGEQMGKLGAEIGKTMRENNEKIRSAIDEGLKNGKARPVN